MQNDSLDTLLLRHYGPHSAAPEALEQQLSASVRREAASIEEREAEVVAWHQRRFSRREAVRLVAAGAAGAGALGFGMEALRALEAGFLNQNQDTTRPAYS